MPTPTAIDAANKFRQDLANEEAASAERMARIYSRVYTDLLGQAQRLAADLSDADEISQKKALQFARTRELLRQVREQAARFATTIENEVVVVRGQAAAMGVENALKLMEYSLPDGLKGLTASFTRLPSDAIEAAAGLTAADSPLMQGLREKYGEYVASQVEEKLLNGIAAGRGPGAIAAQLERNLREALGAGLTSALTTIRTAQMTAYRTANHATYLANSKIVKGWVWHAELGPRTCMSCIAQHGSVHPLTETLNDHHNGRCAALPQTVSYKDLGLDLPETVTPTETGEAWFGRQPAETQREMMGPGLFEAWKAGRVGFGDFSRGYDDPVYGTMQRQATLKEMGL